MKPEVNELGERVWTWSFDPEKDIKMVKEERFPYVVCNHLSISVLSSMQCCTAFILGSDSVICPPKLLNYNKAIFGNKFPFITVEGAGHHLMASFLGSCLSCSSFFPNRFIMKHCSRINFSHNSDGIFEFHVNMS